MRTDPELRASAEWAVLEPILSASGESSGRLLAVAANVCQPPLHQWFADPARKAIAVALDAALAGTTPSDAQGVAAYLAGLPHGTLFEITTGRPVAPWKAVEFEGSALQSVGGFNAISAPLEQVGRAATMPASARTLRSLVERDRAMDALRAIATEVERCDLAKGPADVIASGIDRLSGLVSGGAGARNLGDCLDAAMATAEMEASLRDSGQGSPCTWGIRELDLLCPLRPGRLVVLSAPPGAGKTSLALMSAAATAQAGGKGSVALVSLEMTGEELATILAARELQISPSAIREWTDAASGRAQEIRDVAGQWRTSDAMMVRDLEAGGQRQTAAAVTAWLRQRQTISNHRLALGIVDYLGLLDSEGNQREYDTLTKATRTLKRTALTLRLPILCLAQMNREGRKADRGADGKVSTTPEPRLEDLRGSGSIEQDADAVVFIHLPQGASQEPSVAGQIIVAKNRGGPTGRIDVVFHRRHQLFAAIHREPANKMFAAPQDSEDQFK